MSERRSRHSGHRRHRHRSQSSSERSLSPKEYGRPSPRRDIRRLIKEHEHELEEINDYRSRSLASFAASKAAEVEQLKAQQVQIRSDFAYNLKLLEERDAELDRYDTLLGKMSTQLKSRDQEVNRLNDVIHEQTQTITALQEQIRVQYEKHRKEAFERERELETIAKDHHEQIIAHHNIIDALKNDHLSELSTKSNQFQTEIEDLKCHYQQEISELSRNHRAEVAKLQKALIDQQNESEVEVEELKAKLHAVESSSEEQSVISLNMMCEKDEHIRMLEEENGRLVEMKHELLLQYEEKIGEVLGSLHELEQQFSQQRLAFQTRLQQLSSERDQLSEELKRTAEQSKKEIEKLMTISSEREEQSRETIAKLEESNRQLIQQVQDRTSDRSQLENKCAALQQIVDERNDHVAVLKDLIRKQNESIEAAEKENVSEQQHFDSDLFQKVSATQERLENLIQSLLNSDSNGSVTSAVNLAEQADNLSELQSGLTSIKKTIHSRTSTLSRSSSRHPSLVSTLPRTEQILSEIPDSPSISRRLSSTVVRPMEVEIISPSAANMTVDIATPEQSGLEQVVELSTDDDDIISSHHDRTGSAISNISEIVNSDEAVRNRSRASSLASSQTRPANVQVEALSPLSQCPSSPNDFPPNSPNEIQTSKVLPRRSASSSSLPNRRRATSLSPVVNRERYSDDLSRIVNCNSSFDLKKVNVETMEVEEAKDVNNNANDKSLRSRRTSRVLGSAHLGLPTVQESIDDDELRPRLSSSEDLDCDDGAEMTSSLKHPATDLILLQETARQIDAAREDRSQIIFNEAETQTTVLKQMQNNATMVEGCCLESTGCQTAPATSDVLESNEHVLKQEIDILKDEIKQRTLMVEMLKKKMTLQTDHKECHARVTSLESELERYKGQLTVAQLESHERETLRRQAIKDLELLKADFEKMKSRAVSEDRERESALCESRNQVEALQMKVNLLEQQNNAVNEQLASTFDEEHRSEGERILAEFEKLRQQNNDALTSSKSHSEEKFHSVIQENKKLRDVIQDMKQELGSIQAMQQSMSNEMTILKQTKKDQERHIESLVNLLDDSKSGRSDREDILQYLNQIDKTNAKLVEMSDRLTEADKRLLEKEHQYRRRVEQYENELQELKHELKLAQKSLHRQENNHVGNQPGFDNSPAYLEEIHHLNDRLNESSVLLVQYREARDRALEQLHKAESERDNLRIQLDQQFRLVDILKNRLETVEVTGKPSSRHDADQLASLRNENEELRQRLEEARNDLSQLDAEKEKLMEISNMLKANISSLSSNEAPMDVPLSHIDVNGEVTNLYNAKLANLERALRDLMRQNQTLRAQINSLISNENSGVAVHRHPGSSEYCTDPLCQLRYVHSLNSALSGRDVYHAQILNNVEKLDEGIQKSMRSTTAPLVVGDITRAPLAEIDTIPEPQHAPESRARQRLRTELGDLSCIPSGDKALHSAKRNFKSVRQAMSMSGRAINLHPVPVSAPDREQRQLRRSRDVQKLVRQRQAIRNYNDKD